MALSIDAAKALVIEFCGTYPVASTIKYKLRETQEELYGPQASREATGTILAAFHPRRGQADFATANFRDEDHFRRTLKHEILGHFGINTFSPIEKRALLDGIIAARNEPSLAALWGKISQLYPEGSASLKAEEVFAFACEEIDPQTRINATAGSQSFKETCIERSRPMQIHDLRHITTMVAEGLHHRRRAQQNFPASDMDQFKKDNTPQAQVPIGEPRLTHAWRQAFKEINSMPENTIRLDDPAVLIPDVTPQKTDAGNLQVDALPEKEMTPPLAPADSTAATAPEVVQPQAPEQAAPGLNEGESPGTAQVGDGHLSKPSQDEAVIPPEESPLRSEQQTQQQTEAIRPDAADAPEALENGFSFTFGRLPGDVTPEDAPVPKINLDELLQGLTSRQEDRSWIYSLDGEEAFRDFGDRIVMATPQASENDRTILAALLSAKANQRGAVEITGSDQFIQKTLTLIADHNIEVHLKNPRQREQFDALLKSRAAEAVAKDGMTFDPHAAPAAPAHADTANPAPTPSASPATNTDSPTPTKSSQPAAPEMSVFEKETLRTGLTGKLLNSGCAPYQFDKDNTDSFYVQLRTKDGKKTFWGIELEQALNDSGIDNGDMVKLQFLGKKPVTVNVPVKNAKGEVTGYERLDTHRTQWSVTSATDSRLLVADKNSIAPAALSAYDGNAFWRLQQQIDQSMGLSLALPNVTGHGLLYTAPDGQGQTAPEVPPVNTPVPVHSKSAGSIVMQAFAANGELLAHLVKGHGDYLQGVIRHEGQLQHVLARLCSGNNGNTWLALNAVQDNGNLRLIGHASAINSIKKGAAHYDTFAFQMKGKEATKFAVPLFSPEKIPPALHSKLGFSQAYAPPKAEEPLQIPRAQIKPANQPQPI